ncbi:MAG: hypothetical protein WCT22_03175 [Patescibacteria group bacterium]|jgi:hypothetical protein
MDNIIKYISKNFVSSILITVLTGLTITTSAAGTVKLLGSMNSFKPAVPEVKGVQDIKQVTPTPIVKVSGNKPIAGNTVSNTLSNLTKKLIAVISPTPVLSSSNNTPQNNNTCIITLFGKQYDVFTLQTTHPGGNVFHCNTDMTSVYLSQHGTDVSRMQKYLIASTGTTNSNTDTGAGTGPPTSSSGLTPTTSLNKDNNRRENDDDREDQEDNQGAVHREFERNSEFSQTDE